MKSLFITLVVLCATLALAQAPPAKPLTPLEQTLISSEKDFLTAVMKGDKDYLQRTLAEDYAFVSFDGELGNRQDWLDGISPGGVDFLPYEFKVLSVSDNVAIVTYNVVMRVPSAEDQGPPPRYQHFSTVWSKSGDSWKIKFQQMTVAHFGDW